MTSCYVISHFTPPVLTMLKIRPFIKFHSVPISLYTNLHSLYFRISRTHQGIRKKSVAGAHPPQVRLLPNWLETSLTLAAGNLPVAWIGGRDICKARQNSKKRTSVTAEQLKIIFPTVEWREINKHKKSGKENGHLENPVLKHGHQKCLFVNVPAFSTRTLLQFWKNKVWIFSQLSFLTH